MDLFLKIKNNPLFPKENKNLIWSKSYNEKFIAICQPGDGWLDAPYYWVFDMNGECVASFIGGRLTGEWEPIKAEFSE